MKLHNDLNLLHFNFRRSPNKSYVNTRTSFCLLVSSFWNIWYFVWVTCTERTQSHNNEEKQLIRIVKASKGRTFEKIHLNILHVVLGCINGPTRILASRQKRTSNKNKPTKCKVTLYHTNNSNGCLKHPIYTRHDKEDENKWIIIVNTMKTEIHSHMEDS